MRRTQSEPGRTRSESARICGLGRCEPDTAIISRPRPDDIKPQHASHLGIGRQTLPNLVNERASVSIEMAYRLPKAFGSIPETRLGMQLAFGPARSRHLENTIDVERIAAV